MEAFQSTLRALSEEKGKLCLAIGQGSCRHLFASDGMPLAHPPTTRQIPSGFLVPRIWRTMLLQWPMQSTSSRALISFGSGTAAEAAAAGRPLLLALALLLCLAVRLDSLLAAPPLAAPLLYAPFCAGTAGGCPETLHQLAVRVLRRDVDTCHVRAQRGSKALLDGNPVLVHFSRTEHCFLAELAPNS